MLLADSLLIELTGEEAHFECKQQALLSRHGTLNFGMDCLGCECGVANTHRKMVSRDEILLIQNGSFHPAALWKNEPTLSYLSSTKAVILFPSAIRCRQLT